jgi:hypothetical protein
MLQPLDFIVAGATRLELATSPHEMRDDLT